MGIFHLSHLFRVQWDENAIRIEYETNQDLRRVSAIGSLSAFQGHATSVRIEFFGAVPLFVVCYGRHWGLLLGSNGGHPFLFCNEIGYGNSDGSSRQRNLKALPNTTSKVDQLNALFAYNIKWFLEHASDSQH
jgi:hypothetical protein